MRRSPRGEGDLWRWPLRILLLANGCFLLAALSFGGSGALTGCASPSSAARSHYRDYALAVGKPYPAEAAVAQRRVDHYLGRLTPERRKTLEPYQYLAVEATTIPASEAMAFMKRLVDRGEIGGSMAHDVYNVSGTTALFIMVFDVKTGRPATDEGYVALETPRKGQPGLFGGYDALYIGNGR